jgi:hypothetical protein
LIALAKENLAKAGAQDITAFRAGDFAANSRTLQALKNCGIEIDSSYNACYPRSLGDVSALRSVDQPVELSGLWEFPVAVWGDGLGSNRHAQICSCSSAELEGAILSAWKNGWNYFVIVSHSFELLKKRRKRVADPAPDPIVVRRFNRLCQFLSENSDKFRTRHFSQIDLASLRNSEPAKPIHSPAYRTAWRMAEQTRRRLAY